MATEALISWNAPEHLHTEKGPDWYWIVGVITLALAAVSLIFGNIITAIFIVVAVTALVIHASKPPRVVYHEINDRGVVIDSVLYPFLNLDAFCIPHDDAIPKLIMRSRHTFAPYLVIYIEEVDPEDIRAILIRYIAEKELREPLLKVILERLGF